MEQGKVWLVGAGPGDIGLLTRKGFDVLKNADVVVYDSLVGRSILAQIPESAEKINVGKRASHHTMPQEEINQVLLSEALKGKKVVRLKGGDPFLFGRGGEELELLTEKGIPYEVIPGVTSSIAVPAYNGIPVTHRDFCSSVHIITGHRKAGEEEKINFDALVAAEGTLVFLMGVRSLENICTGLLKAGMDPEMPAALLMKGTTAGQKRIVSVVSRLSKEVKRQGAETPAIIVVGKVCALADDFEWHEKLPLAGWRVLVTRPQNRSSRTVELLRKKGAEVLELPSICTRPLKNQELLHEAFSKISSYRWIAFTSPTGVEVFFDELRKAGKDVRLLHGLGIAAIGQGTAKALREAGIMADLIPETYDGESLGRALAEKLEGGERILLPRAEVGNQELVQILEKAGARVEDIPTYETVYHKSEIIDLEQEFKDGSIDCVVFTSASTVKGFCEGVPLADYSGVTAACIGRQTCAAADEKGMKTYTASRATIDALVELVEKIKEEQE